MMKSASLLGRDYCMTGEEMNRLLLKQGFLEGKPGDYTPTAKAMPYVRERDFHRGCGGYAHYNRYWTTVSYDESILDALGVSPSIIQEVKKEVFDARELKKAARAAARKAADEEFLARQAAEKAAQEAEKLAAQKAEKLAGTLKTAGTVVVVGLVFLGCCYIAYRTAPKVKQWWEDRRSDRLPDTDKHPEEN